jgi:hypothetical protein
VGVALDVDQDEVEVALDHLEAQRVRLASSGAETLRRELAVAARARGIAGTRMGHAVGEVLRPQAARRERAVQADAANSMRRARRIFVLAARDQDASNRRAQLVLA